MTSKPLYILKCRTCGVLSPPACLDEIIAVLNAHNAQHPSHKKRTSYYSIPDIRYKN